MPRSVACVYAFALLEACIPSIVNRPGVAISLKLWSCVGIWKLEKQKKLLQVSRQRLQKREEDFEKKALKYSKAISAVAPGGAVDSLKDKVSALNDQIRVSTRTTPKVFSRREVLSLVVV